MIYHPLPDDIDQWENVSQLDNVLHTEEIQIVSVAGGNLEIEPFCIVDADCRIVAALVYHCCDQGLIHSYDETPFNHIFQSGPDTCVSLECWELNPKEPEAEIDACWIDDPCERANELRCCLMEWLKQGKKKSFSWRDRSGDYSYLSEASLWTLINEAEAECDDCKGVNNRCVTFTCGARCGC